MRQAQAASAKGDTDLALRLAQAAIVADPARPATYDALGDVYAGATRAISRSTITAKRCRSIPPIAAATSGGTAAGLATADQRAAEAAD